MKRLLLGFVCAVFGLAAAVVGTGVAVSYLALPQTEGQAKLPGLAAAVSVTRDARGVPWINAGSAADAYMALGYVHAQDRLFQMELMRRLGQGRLAEILGQPGVGSDKFMRTLGLYKRTQDNLPSLDEETRIAVDAYARGVNAYIAANALPLEYKVLFFAPEPWTAADSLVWQKLMGLQLSGNWPEELSRAAIMAKLGPEKAAALWPNVDGASPVTLAAAELFTKLRTAMLDVVRPSLASNIWAVAPSRTSTGGALLANDPHLNFQAPNMWYLAGLSYPGVDLVGATVPGVPFHLLGHNGSLAWGFTTTHGDTQDLFVETPVEGGYATPDGPAPFTTREETIKVRFGAAQTLTVRETRHGPVISDILPAEDLKAVGGKAVALAATLLAADDRSIDAIYRMARAKTTQEFRAAAALFHAPQQNVMFADARGSIGYIAVGRVPLRKSALCDGLTPADGAAGQCDWMGWAAFDALPQVLDPATGVLINANNKIVPDDFPLLIAKDWPEGYRAQRIEEVLAGRSGLTMKDMDTLQHDAVSLMAREMLPLLLARLDAEDELKVRLAAWDGTMGRDRTEPLVFALWMERLKSRLIEDELGGEYAEFRGARPALIKAILTKDTSWCDDVRTPQAETCAAQIGAAWADTAAWLQQHAPRPDQQQWGRWHIARFGHAVFGNLPGLSGLGGFAAPTDGDDATVNRGSFAGSTSRAPFRHRHGAGVRAIYDLADLRRSRFSLAGGQSAHMLSHHFDDLMAGWADGEMFALTRPEKGTGRLLILNN